MPQLTKVLFIGLDAADKDLIHQWMEEGHLPTFKHLRETGAWGPTHNPPGLYVGAIWPSFHTSVSPAQHRCYCYRQLKLGSYDTQAFRAPMQAGESFWNQLSRANKKVAVIDVPKTEPSRDLNGIHIVDWGGHDPEDKIRTWPPSLADEMIKMYGENSLVDCNTIDRDAPGFMKFKESLKSRIKKKTDMSLHFLKQGGWDTFLTVFSESHCVGHQAWHLHEPTNALHDPDIVKITGDLMKDVYIALDEGVGKILKHVGPDTPVIVLASHGMGHHYDGNYLLDEMLEKLELFNDGKSLPRLNRTVKDGTVHLMDSVLKGAMRPKGSRKYRRIVKMLKWVRDRLPPGVGIRMALKHYTTARIEEKKRLAFERLRERKYFAIPNNDTFGGIRINLVGREPNGKVHPGAEYDDLLQSLTQDLLGFTNADTGKPVITQVLRTDEIYQGPHRDELPDLMPEWSRAAPIHNVYSPKTGTIPGAGDSPRTGDHKPEGLFFAVGPSIQPGPIGKPVSVMDLAPTLASILGVELSGIEGQSFAPLIEKKKQHT